MVVEKKKVLKIGIAADHAGYEYKEWLVKELRDSGYEVTDFGCPGEESCDYPDYAHPLANAVDKGRVERGISICGSGNGINMVVNKHQNIRSALCWNEEIATLARTHNDANICALPARFVSKELVMRMVILFLTEDFEGGRHQRRIDKIPMS